MYAADAVAVALLKSDVPINSAVGGRISTDYRKGAAQIRVTFNAGGDAAQEVMRASILVECWADDQIVAGQTAMLVRERWPQLRGAVADAYVAGCWVEANPSWAPDPDSGRPRYILTVGMWVQ
jgi:hypothetical protein